MTSGAGEYDIVMLYGYAEQLAIHVSPYRRFIVLLPEIAATDTSSIAARALSNIATFLFESNYIGANTRSNDVCHCLVIESSRSRYRSLD